MSFVQLAQALARGVMPKTAREEMLPLAQYIGAQGLTPQYELLKRFPQIVGREATETDFAPEVLQQFGMQVNPSALADIRNARGAVDNTPEQLQNLMLLDRGRDTAGITADPMIRMNALAAEVQRRAQELRRPTYVPADDGNWELELRQHMGELDWLGNTDVPVGDITQASRESTLAAQQLLGEVPVDQKAFLREATHIPDPVIQEAQAETARMAMDPVGYTNQEILPLQEADATRGSLAGRPDITTGFRMDERGFAPFDAGDKPYVPNPERPQDPDVYKRVRDYLKEGMVPRPQAIDFLYRGALADAMEQGTLPRTQLDQAKLGYEIGNTTPEQQWQFVREWFGNRGTTAVESAHAENQIAFRPSKSDEAIAELSRNQRQAQQSPQLDPGRTADQELLTNQGKVDQGWRQQSTDQLTEGQVGQLEQGQVPVSVNPPAPSLEASLQDTLAELEDKTTLYSLYQQHAANRPGRLTELKDEMEQLYRRLTKWEDQGILTKMGIDLNSIQLPFERGTHQAFWSPEKQLSERMKDVAGGGPLRPMNESYRVKLLNQFNDWRDLNTQGNDRGLNPKQTSYLKLLNEQWANPKIQKDMERIGIPIVDGVPQTAHLRQGEDQAYVAAKNQISRLYGKETLNNSPAGKLFAALRKVGVELTPSQVERIATELAKAGKGPDLEVARGLFKSLRGSPDFGKLPADRQKALRKLAEKDQGTDEGSPVTTPTTTNVPSRV